MRLIDADALQKALAQMWFDSQISITGISVSVLIDNQPTIEAEPVRRGRWIKQYAPEGYVDPYKCSVCGEADFGIEGYAYCPFCGARMEVDE